MAAGRQGLAAQRAPLWRADRPQQAGDDRQGRRRAGQDLAPLASTSRRRRSPADSPYDVSRDRRYAGVEVPRTESLKDTIARAVPYYEAEIAPALQAGKRVLVVRPRQFAARDHQISVEHRRRGDRRARDPDRQADRLRARRRAVGRAALLSGREPRPRPCAGTSASSARRHDRLSARRRPVDHRRRRSRRSAAAHRRRA